MCHHYPFESETKPRILLGLVQQVYPEMFVGTMRSEELIVEQSKEICLHIAFIARIFKIDGKGTKKI